MEEIAIRTGIGQSWVREKIFMSKPFTEYVTSLLTPFNVVAAIILLCGLPLIVLRYAHGLTAILNPSNTYPWGLFICFGLLGIVPLSATGYIMASAVYLFGMKEYRPLLRLALLTGFLGYFFAVVFIFMDIGRSWRLPFPMLASYGTASVLFLVAWHVALYLTTSNCFRRNPVNTPSISARCPLSPHAGEGSSSLVLAIYPRFLLHVQHLRRHLHDHPRQCAVTLCTQREGRRRLSIKPGQPHSRSCEGGLGGTLRIFCDEMGRGRPWKPLGSAQYLLWPVVSR